VKGNGDRLTAGEAGQPTVLRAEGEGGNGVADDRIVKLKPGATQDHVSWDGYDHKLVGLLVRANLSRLRVLGVLGFQVRHVVLVQRLRQRCLYIVALDSVFASLLSSFLSI